MATQSVTERFRNKVVKGKSCWVWAAGVSGGYGTFSVNGQMVAAHRYSYEQANGPIPDGMKVCHHCDNMLCVNPEHLFVGTQGDNMRDMRAKGRGYVFKRGTHCKAGHLFTPETEFWTKAGRRCRICRNLTNKLNKRKMRAMKARVA